MSITYKKQDITTVSTGIVIHGVNCLGKMGSGVALAIRNKWSQVYTEYNEYVSNVTGTPADLLGLVQIVDIDTTLKVANCFTQVNYGNDGHKYANIDAVEETLSGVFTYASLYDLPIFLPTIGCGLGGLSWVNEVEPILKSLSEEYPQISVTVCTI